MTVATKPLPRPLLNKHIQWCPHGKQCRVCCWPWTGKIRHDVKDGVVYWQGRHNTPARVVWELLVEPLRPRAQLRRTCGTSRCCQPGHRMPVGGEEFTWRSPKASLTHAQLMDVWHRWQGGETLTSLALAYGVHQQGLSAAMQRLRTVFHLTPSRDTGRGRPGKLSRDDLVRLWHRRQAGATIASLAHEVGVNKQNLGRYLKRIGKSMENGHHGT